MNLVKQPPNSNLCGQACVAMIAGITLEQSISLFGKRGCTTTKDVAFALKCVGIPCEDKLIRFRKVEDPRTAAKTAVSMVVLHYEGAPRHHGHWVVLCGGLYYDPSEGVTSEYTTGVRITSYLPIYLTEGGVGSGKGN